MSLRNRNESATFELSYLDGIGGIELWVGLVLNRSHHRGVWTPSEDEALRRMAEQGIWLHDLADRLGRSQEAVRTRANNLHVPVRSAPRKVLQGQKLRFQLG